MITFNHKFIVWFREAFKKITGNSLVFDQTGGGGGYPPTKPLKDFPFFLRKKQEIGPNLAKGGGDPPLVKYQTISLFLLKA